MLGYAGMKAEGKIEDCLPGSGVIIGEMKISDMICITEAEGFNALKGADLFDY
jgi:hypothetical protein